MGETVRITLPSTSPELYLKGVRWGREAIDYATSAAIPGRIPKKRRGADPVLDFLLYDAPEAIETQALQAQERGGSEVAPVLEAEEELLRQALDRAESIWNSLMKTLRTGGPPLDEDIVELRTRTRARTEQALEEAAS
jgi:hypothetical protein